jgi:hypothetical protein
MPKNIVARRVRSGFERAISISDLYFLMPNDRRRYGGGLILPESGNNNSVRWKEMKRQFTQRYLAEVGPGESRSLSKQKRCRYHPFQSGETRACKKGERVAMVEFSSTCIGKLLWRRLGTGE